MQVFGKDSILHLGGVETADSREAWAADTNMEVRAFFLAPCVHAKKQQLTKEARQRRTCVRQILSASNAKALYVPFAELVSGSKRQGEPTLQPAVVQRLASAAGAVSGWNNVQHTFISCCGSVQI